MWNVQTGWLTLTVLLSATCTVFAQDTAAPRPAEENLMSILPQADRPFADRFAKPPAQARILQIVHGLPDAPQAQDELLASLISRGFGGIVTNVSFAGYVEDDAKWQAFVRGVQEAKKRGMALWLYDEKGYPSGAAGGITLRDHPEWEARGIYVADADTKGGTVALELPPGTLVRAAAFPVVEGRIDPDRATDLAPHVRDRQLTWEAPPGDWRVMVFTEDRLYEGTHAAVSLADKLPYVNLLMPEPTARFLEVTHGRYAAHLGADLGRTFIATFTDEPSLMSMFMRPEPYRVLPWAPGLAAEFQKRRGYALDPVLPALFAEAGPSGARARYDFWLTVGELVADNFFGQIQTWCRAHNIPSGGHLLLEEPLLTHVPLYGDFFRCARRLDAPSIDCLTSIPDEVPWYIARLIGSAAELEGRTVTMCETSDHCQRYRPAGDQRPVRNVSEDEIRGTCNRLIMNGITTITSYYSFAGLDDAQVVRLNEWIGRCCTAVSGGHQVADIAVLYPIESIWPHFTPSRNWVHDAPAAAHQVQTAYETAAQCLYKAGRDFTFIDSRTLAEAKVEDGTLCHGALKWRVVVLPCVDTLPWAAWENLARFWRAGGAVIALTVPPANSDREFPSAQVQALGKEVFGEGAPPLASTNPAGGAGILLRSGAETLLPHVIEGLLEPDLRVSGPGAPIHATHRRIDGEELYMVINDGPNLWQGTLTFAAHGPGEQWNPADGKMTPCAAPENVPGKFGPYGAMIYRFKTARLPQRLPAGALPALRFSAMPQVEPTVGKGEFVQAELVPDKDRTSDQRFAWRATGVITKAKVDTFLFACFEFPQPVDLRDALAVAVDVWVPAVARSPVQLLIVLRDQHDDEYFVQAGVGLDRPGQTQSVAPLERFQPAGWHVNPRTEFDFSAVTTLRVGWGGYYGAEGKRVEFSLSAPHSVRAEKPGQ